MALVDIPDESKEVMNRCMDLIKSEYVTQRLFIDSAIRSRLRSMGIDVGEDMIVAHLRRLEKSKQQHLDKQSISQTRLRHSRRVGIARQRLDKGIQ